MVIAIIFLGFVGYQRYSLPIDATMITPESFYRGTKGTNMSVKEYYNRLHGITIDGNDDDSCNVNLKHYESPITIGDNTVMFSDKPLDCDYSNKTDVANKIGPVGECCFSENGLIILPVSWSIEGNTFRNSNIKNSTFNSTSSSKDIEVILSNRVILVFEDVRCWWCHNHSPETSHTHTKHVGNASKSEVKQASLGDVIGMSKETTVAKLYYIPDGDDSLNALNVKDLGTMQQIHLGKWLTDRTIEPVSGS